MARTIATRVLIVAVASAALGALAAALVAIASVDRLLSVQADQRLRGAAIELGGELAEGHRLLTDAQLMLELDDENGEIAPSGIRLGVFRAGVLVAGEDAGVVPDSGRCLTSGSLGERMRVCSQHHGDVVLVAAAPADELKLRGVYLVAALGALLLGAACGAVLSSRLGRWAVAPLQMLADKLRQSRPERGMAIDLGPPSDCQDVESIRRALSGLMEHVDVLLNHAHRFAADAAHELRTPLATLRAELELLAEESQTDHRQSLDRATQKVKRLAELVERLLVLALPTQKIAGGFETVALEDVVAGVVGELRASDRGRLQVDCENEGLVRGDSYLLHTLVFNAIDNALKYGGSGTITVRLTGSKNPLESVFEVIDHGPGLGDVDQTRVFEPFYRGKRLGAGGHGLGLALVGHIAEVHGGRAEFRTAEIGVHLTVSFPAWTPRADSPASRHVGTD